MQTGKENAPVHLFASLVAGTNAPGGITTMPSAFAGKGSAVIADRVRARPARGRLPTGVCRRGRHLDVAEVDLRFIGGDPDRAPRMIRIGKIEKEFVIEKALTARAAHADADLVPLVGIYLGVPPVLELCENPFVHGTPGVFGVPPAAHG